MKGKQESLILVARECEARPTGTECVFGEG